MANRYPITGGASVVWDAVDTSIWSATSGGATGASVPGPGDDVIMDGNSGGGTVTLGYSPTVNSITMGAFTGTFDASTYSPTMATFSCSGTAVRTLSMGSGTWTLTGNNASIFNVNDGTNLTVSASTAVVDCTYSGSTGIRNLFGGTKTYTCSFKISAGSDTVSFSSTTFTGINNLDFTGFTGSWSGNVITVNGNLTFGAGMTVTASANTLTLGSTSGTKTITSNGVAIDRPVTFNGVGGTWQLVDAMTVGSSRTVTLTNGTFDANGFNVTCGLFNSSNSNTRTLTMGSGTWTLTGTGTVFNTGTVTNLTFSGASATIYVTDTSSALKTLALGTGVTPIGTLRIAPGGTGPIAFSNGGTRVFTTLEVTGPKTIVWQSARTYQATNFTINSSIDRPVTFLSDVPGTQYTLSVASGTVGSRFMSIFDCIGTGGATFVARESYGNNTTGWTIVPPRINQAMATESYALNFPNNAAVDVVSASNSGVAANGSWSLCAWIDITGYTGTRQDIHGVNFTPTNSAISVGSTGLYTLNDPIGLVATTVRAPIGRMVPVVTTWDATNARGSMYFDGYLIYTRTGTATAFTDGKIVTGRFAFSAAQPAWAAVSRRRIFARTLSAEEVMAWSRNNVEPDDTGLRAEYNLLAGSGSTDVDTSGNGNNGTITGATWVTDRVYTARVAAANRVPTSGRNAATNRVQL